MLKIEGLTKKYGKLKACSDIDLELEDGSVNVLLGPNGAWKSTLMKSVLGLIPGYIFFRTVISVFCIFAVARVGC